MGRETQPYKRSMGGQLGAGVKSIVGGSKKSYYILEHKIGSKYHHTGEKQEIIVDQVEIGRDPKCQVRYDEHFETVSRRHAAIVRDGANWKLMPLSKTNPTFLNGERVMKEWFLQDGDEIQLAINGPKLKFIVPSGEKANAGSIGLSRRLKLFGKQALRPYRWIVIVLAIIVLIIIAVGGYFIFTQGKTIGDYSKIIDDYSNKLTDNQIRINAMAGELAQDKELQEQLNEQIKRLKVDFEKVKQITMDQPSGNDSQGVDLKAYHPYIYLMKIYKITVDGEALIEVDPGEHSIWCGTGFLLNDGRLVTARHLVTRFYSSGYRFDQNGKFIVTDPGNWGYHGMGLFLNYLSNCGRRVILSIRAVSPNGSLELTNEDFVSFGSKDQVYYLDDPVFWNSQTIPAGAPVRVGAGNLLDWAFCKTDKKGGLTANKELSINLQQGTQLYVLGHPNCSGEKNPVLSTALCPQNGLDANGTILTSNDNIEAGNSGAPVFVRRNNKYEIAGIVTGDGGLKSSFVPVAAIDMNN